MILPRSRRQGRYPRGKKSAAAASTTNNLKPSEGDNENALSIDPSRIGDQLCFADLRPTEGRRIPQMVHQRDLLGLPKALDEFGELNRGLDEAYNTNDAAAAAALFTEDALLVAPDGMFSGRQHIEERYADAFQRSPNIDFNCSRDRIHLNAIDNAVWSAGQWFGTFQSQAGPVFAWGYWSAIYVPEGDAWKIRMLTLEDAQRPALRTETK